MRRALLPFMLAVAAAGPAAGAQGTLAARVASAPNGEVRLQYAGRPGVCGDGRDLVGFRNALFTRSVESYGRWTSSSCIAGSVRVTITVEGGQVVALRTQVGGSWPTSRATDLGTVAPGEAAGYFLALVPRLEALPNRNRLLLPAVLAADADVVPPLLALARDASRADRTRRQALQWVGQLGDASVVPALVAFARDGGAATTRGEDYDDDDERPGKKGLASAATAALATLDDGAGVPALLDLLRTGNAGTRHTVVFWLGQSGDPRAVRALHGVIENEREEPRVRAHAIFALTHGDVATEAELAYLRGLYPRLGDDEPRKAVLQAAAQDETSGGRWLLERARDPRERLEMRRDALFWAGQREATPTRDLVAAFREIDEPNLKEHAIFVLSQRQDDAATDALLRIARDDGDRRLRARALFWLAQKNDPRVTKLIRELLER